MTAFDFALADVYHPIQDAERALDSLREQLRVSSKREQTLRKRLRLLQKELDLANRHQAEAADQERILFYKIAFFLS